MGQLVASRRRSEVAHQVKAVLASLQVLTLAGHGVQRWFASPYCPDGQLLLHVVPSDDVNLRIAQTQVALSSLSENL